jgi:hypothetical protein
MHKRINITLIIGLFVVFLTITVGCKRKNANINIEQSLEISGNNRPQLQKVIDHYSKNPSDSLKLKAIKFLIINGKKNYSLKYDNSYDYAFTVAKNAYEKFSKKRNLFSQEYLFLDERNIHTLNVFNKIYDSIENTHPNTFIKLDLDLQVITADFLIENIDLAFYAYENNNLNLCNDFNTFLKYILPYRISNEYLEDGKRKELFFKYKWARELLKQKPLETVLKKLYDTISIQSTWGKNRKFNRLQTLSQTEKIKTGNCMEGAIYLVHVLRAIGIPACIDYCPRLGNLQKDAGHNWLTVFNKDKFIAINVTLDRFEILNELYKISDLPKVYRKYYGECIDLDVTNSYKKSYSIKLPISKKIKFSKKEDKFYLGVFDINKGWSAIIEADKIENEEAIFNHVGSEIIYILLKKNSFSTIPINNPFTISSEGEIKYFVYSEPLIKEVNLTRKYLPYIVRDKKINQKIILSLNTCVIQGSNDLLFEKSDELYKFENFNSTHLKKINLKTKKYYRYYRIINREENSTIGVRLAKFNFLNSNNEKLLFLINDPDQKNILDKLTDDDDLTNVKNVHDYVFENIKQDYVKSIEIQVSNDDNHIKIGDQYELCFFKEGKWVSLYGPRIATDTVLKYTNLSSKSLYLLKNLSRGVEEFPFTLDNNGNQYWIGTTKYENEKLPLIENY